MPRRDIEGCVRPEDQNTSWSEFLDRRDRVGGTLPPYLPVVHGKPIVFCGGQACHRKTVPRLGDILMPLLPGISSGDELNDPHIELLEGGMCDREVADVWWIEGSAEESVHARQDRGVYSRPGG